MLAGHALFADDTPVKVLAPGTGKTSTGRAWIYVRDERPWKGEAPPAAWYRFSADRKAEHPKAHLTGFGGWMHSDGYAGFGKLARAGPVREVACLAHVRRKFFDVHAAQGSAIAAEALERIAALYAVEKEARGQPPDRRVAIRGAKAGPRLDDLERWLQTQLPRVSAAGGKAAAIAYTLIETAKLNDVDPQAWLADVLERIPDYKINRVDELLPWNCPATAQPTADI